LYQKALGSRPEEPLVVEASEAESGE
jgi:hypothetical protein